VSRDESDIRAALEGWYAAMTAHDIAAVSAALTESFLLVEHDDLVDRPGLLEMLSGETDDELIATLSDFHVTVSGDIAWSTHRNHEVYTGSGADPLQLEFLETVVLVRRSGRWLIDRYHATRLSPISL
jgi:ketosteroid isomerase-like protein